MKRFIPIQGSTSATAPGYSGLNQNLVSTDDLIDRKGPICWKCQGSGLISKKSDPFICTVCHGKLTLPVKEQFARKSSVSGKISIQKTPQGWTPRAPLSAFNENDVDKVEGLYLNPGEELCGLINNWKIFQHRSGHRWTTDDLVTSWVAGKQFDKQNPPRQALDLGCGNGSVLQMVACQFAETNCLGVEARPEAVGLARRSIFYNCGSNGKEGRVRVVHADFRTLIPPVGQDLDEFIPLVLEDGSKFELVTGTPPYFRIDFAVTTETLDENATKHPVVEKAIIRQGGMPTVVESAPARCEFRGGIEAYCQAAKVCLAQEGRFVVCENWLNHARVLRAAKSSGLCILSIHRVFGKEGKPPLFCVYTMAMEEASEVPISNIPAATFDDIVVRDANGAWTLQYADILRDVHYPVASLHPNGTY